MAFTVTWISGLSGAGKTTYGQKIKTPNCVLLDGDVLREGINSNLGYDKESRYEAVRRTSHLAAHLGQLRPIIVCQCSPYRAARKAARKILEDSGCEVIMIYLECSKEVRELRKPELYRIIEQEEYEYGGNDVVINTERPI